MFTAAKYDWVQAAVSITASGRDLRMNSGKNQIIDLMKARTKNAMRTAANNMSIDLYSDGALSNQMGGLAHIVQNDGTGTVGGINSSAYAFWANQYREMSGTGTWSKSTIKNDMKQMWLTCVRGTDKPDLIVSTHDFYTAYWDNLSDLQRYRNDDLPDTFTSVKFMSADVIFDSNDNFSTTGALLAMRAAHVGGGRGINHTHNQPPRTPPPSTSPALGKRTRALPADCRY